MLPQHSFGRKNNNGRNVRLKNLQPTVDLPLVGNDYANRVGRLPAFNSRLAQVCLRQPEPDVVALECAVADQDGVGQRALTKQMLPVFPRREIDRRKIPGRDFSIDRHRESSGDKWTSQSAGAIRPPLDAAT